MAKSIEEIYQEARKLIGTESEPTQGRYPVEYEPIRRFCHMVDDTNPLFLDPEYARTTKYGGVICPSLLVGNLGVPGPWPPSAQPSLHSVPSPGDRLINLTTEWEFLRPVRIGDRISSKTRIADIYIKPIRLDPKAFWIQTERVFTNQDGEVIAVYRNLILRHRTPEQIREAGE